MQIVNRTIMAATLDTRENSDAAGRTDAAFAGEIGRLVRLGRAKRGMSRRQLAQESGTSERYLAQIESGAGNPSVLVMRAIADALEIPLFELLPSTGGLAAPYARIIDLLGRASPGDLSSIAEGIERRIDQAAATDRERRIALVGLRGGGKSTLGKMLADKLGVPFIELNRMVEQEYGASMPLLIEMSGVATFKRHERTCLERVISQNERAVIATAGGIVSNPETYGLLLRRTHTVWLSAQPEEHMSRVMRQGDFRPMARNREAMADLHAILEARRGDYARAETALDTSGATVQQSFVKLQKIVAPWIKG
ncbi:MAG: helix-turn-helix domain-containing protein [Xanthobacteraceae bacterium]|nr:helix-turn-helix domain-containing protein [Xanthobacteraceae bacterium]